jgi:hypothetical protein
MARRKASASGHARWWWVDDARLLALVQIACIDCHVAMMDGNPARRVLPWK